MTDASNGTILGSRRIVQSIPIPSFSSNIPKPTSPKNGSSQLNQTVTVNGIAVPVSEILQKRKTDVKQQHPRREIYTPQAFNSVPLRNNRPLSVPSSSALRMFPAPPNIPMKPTVVVSPRVKSISKSTLPDKISSQIQLPISSSSSTTMISNVSKNTTSSGDASASNSSRQITTEIFINRVVPSFTAPQPQLTQSSQKPQSLHVPIVHRTQFSSVNQITPSFTPPQPQPQSTFTQPQPQPQSQQQTAFTQSQSQAQPQPQPQSQQQTEFTQSQPQSQPQSQQQTEFTQSQPQPQPQSQPQSQQQTEFTPPQSQQQTAFTPPQSQQQSAFTHPQSHPQPQSAFIPPQSTFIPPQSQSTISSRSPNKKLIISTKDSSASQSMNFDKQTENIIYTMDTDSNLIESQEGERPEGSKIPISLPSFSQKTDTVVSTIGISTPHPPTPQTSTETNEEKKTQLPISQAPKKPNYSLMTEEQKAGMRGIFAARFNILRQNNSKIIIPELDPKLSLDQIHDIYDYYVKQIVIKKKSSQYKLYVVIMHLTMEALMTKVFSIDAAGYTMSQLQIQDQYDQLLAQLGEREYINEESTWPIELRIVSLGVFQLGLFSILKYLLTSVGVAGSTGDVQSVITKLMSGPDTQMPTRDENGILNPPAPNGGSANGSGGGLMDLLGGGDLSSIAGKLGSLFTNVTQQNKPAQPSGEKPQPKEGEPNPRPKTRKPVFC